MRWECGIESVKRRVSQATIRSSVLGHTKVEKVVGKAKEEGGAVQFCLFVHFVKGPGVPRTQRCQRDCPCLLHSRDPHLLDQEVGRSQRPCQDRRYLDRKFRRDHFWLLFLSFF